MFVPVVDQDHKPLMPSTPARARRWIQRGEATPFWDRGIFCVRLNREPSGRETQDLAVGIDPGSQKEGLTVKSAAQTYLNIQADAVIHVKEAKADQAATRRARRFRNTPCRQPRAHRARGGIPPSTKARWQWKLRLLNWLRRLFPITQVVVEDIQAQTKGQRRWDVAFSPLEVGKPWFFAEVRKVAQLDTFKGHETQQMREALGLRKTQQKTAEVFEAHCVDSWVLAHAIVGGHDRPGNTRLLCVSSLKLHRRELHRREPGKGGVRSPYGGTRSLGFKRGSIVRHPRYGITFVGGASDGRISLHRTEDGQRLCQNAKPSDLHFLAYSTWRARLLPMPEEIVLLLSTDFART
jgi:hypothetical protein